MQDFEEVGKYVWLRLPIWNRYFQTWCKLEVIFLQKNIAEIYFNVLLRERKRHTARRVVSACFADGGGGVPHPVLDRRGYPGLLQIWTWDEVPPVWTWDGVPPIQTWDRVPPPSRPEMGYPPPTSVDRLKILPSIILRMRAVIMDRSDQHFSFYSISGDASDIHTFPNRK